MYRIKLVIIIEIADRQIVDQVARIIVLLNSNKYPLQMTTYLVHDLLFNLIIDNDVLNRDNINFQYNRKIFIIEDVDIFLSYSNANYIIFYYFSAKLFNIINLIKYKK